MSWGNIFARPDPRVKDGSFRGVAAMGPVARVPGCACRRVRAQARCARAMRGRARTCSACAPREPRARASIGCVPCHARVLPVEMPTPTGAGKRCADTTNKPLSELT